MQNKIKNVLLVFIGLVLSSNLAIAQRDNDQRTLPTKIADLLAQLPAEDNERLNSSMSEIASMGKEGVVRMASMLSAPGEGNNTDIEYALGGFSYYVSQPQREALRKMSVDAFCQALEEADNRENRAFLIRQLQLVGQDDAISCLQPYLDDENHCAASAKALINIGSSRADNALLQALQNSNSTCRLTLVHALGDAKNEKAVAVISPLAKSPDRKLRKLALYSLANIADPGSEDVLRKAAEEDNFVYDADNATSAYLLYIERLIENGQKQHGEKMAQSLLKNTRQDLQVHTRTAALRLLTYIQGENSVELLIEAAGNKHPGYRAAALKFAADYITPSVTKKWVKKLKKSNAEVKAGIIAMLGENNAEVALPVIRKQIRSRNNEVKLAAIEAVGRMGGEKALADLLRILRKAKTEEEIVAVKGALFIMDADGLTEEVADALPKVSSTSQAALLEVLGKRAASGRINDVLLYVDDQNNAVRIAALGALEQMATTENLPRLFSLLQETSGPEEIRMVQNAIIGAVEDGDDSRKALVLERMENAGEEKKPRYFNILSSIGGEQALNAISAAYNSGNTATKKAVVQALSEWSDAGAANELYRISQSAPTEEIRKEALNGYVRTVSESEYPDEQKLLMLRKAVEVAQTPAQKKLMLKEIAELKTFPALVFAGKYLNEPALQQEAALAVMTIALNNDFHGDEVRELLNKVIEVIEGPESEYQKQSINKFLEEMPQGKGVVALFNGEDLIGWKGLVANPIERKKMNPKILKQEQEKADKEMRESWIVEDGDLIFTGEGDNIATEKKYGDFEMFVDWKIYDDGHKKGDAGIYLRGTPQVQIWDTSRVDAGAQVGSGGLYNNQVNPSEPLKVADNPLGEWNNFHIIMEGDRVTVFLNGELVTDEVILENFWDRELPIFSEEQIELQAHGSRIAYRDIYIREIPRPEPYELTSDEKREGFEVLFDGTNMHNWMGNTKDYVVENGEMVVREPEFGSGGNLFTKEEYDDFVFRFEFKLTPGANNGLGIRAPSGGNAAYGGMELQILDNEADIYKDLEVYQYHGSVYGVIPAKRGHLKPIGEWNHQEVIVKGSQVKVILNGTTILDGDIYEASKNGTLDGQEHPGLKRDKGHIGFLGHGSEVWFRNIRVKEIK